MICNDYELKCVKMYFETICTNNIIFSVLFCNLGKQFCFPLRFCHQLISSCDILYKYHRFFIFPISSSFDSSSLLLCHLLAFKFPYLLFTRSIFVFAPYPLLGTFSLFYSFLFTPSFKIHFSSLPSILPLFCPFLLPLFLFFSFLSLFLAFIRIHLAVLECRNIKINILYRAIL